MESTGEPERKRHRFVSISRNKHSSPSVIGRHANAILPLSSSTTEDDDPLSLWQSSLLITMHWGGGVACFLQCNARTWANTLVAVIWGSLKDPTWRWRLRWVTPSKGESHSRGGAEGRDERQSRGGGGGEIGLSLGPVEGNGSSVIGLSGILGESKVLSHTVFWLYKRAMEFDSRSKPSHKEHRREKIMNYR
ncbi:hypothetical protein MUK42_37737 [Musa troglodytarum]|uniref:Uncharacterized protein n=1 Tax=Musa troglodytarum TaxID=320322 RepID=A0A9E7K6B4_9LILI|nr:hypothetical protein MUK42_37737 [Musa troglodytarum]